MNAVRLQFPLETLDGRPLIPAGTAITRAFLARFLAGAPAPTTRRNRLLGHRRLKADLLEFCREKPYDAVFFSSAWTRDVFEIIGDCRMRPVFFEFLDYFEKADSYTYRHSLVVYALSVQIARLVEGRSTARRMSAMGPTHDFGKIGVPQAVRIKATPLTAVERARLEHHAIAGYLLLSYYQGRDGDMSSRVARDHHERLDGSGYPSARKRLRREVEIVAAADVYDALISPRPYRRHSYDNRTALEELTAMSDAGRIRLDPVQALVALNRRTPADYRTCGISREKRGRAPAENCHGVLAP
jgi:HD-GYP domain-containing protein (c-di-GMP phosphodiesterase class II)